MSQVQALSRLIASYRILQSKLAEHTSIGASANTRHLSQALDDAFLEIVRFEADDPGIVCSQIEFLLAMMADFGWDLDRAFHEPRIDVSGGDVHVTYTLTTPACPIGPMVAQQIEEFVSELDGVESVESAMTFTPPWTPDRMSEDAKFALGY